MKNTYEFLYRGDNDNYWVRFNREGTVVTATCTCPAGEMGQFCKHRIALMLFDETERVLSNNKNEVAEIKEFLRGTVQERVINKVMEDEKRFNRKLEPEKLINKVKWAFKQNEFGL